jgi:hypothetical protein
MASKQATHLQPIKGSTLLIRVCDLGGFMVHEGARDVGYCGSEASFTTADECADWVRSFLRNRAQDMFGAKKPDPKSNHGF